MFVSSYSTSVMVSAILMACGGDQPMADNLDGPGIDTTGNDAAQGTTEATSDGTSNDADQVDLSTTDAISEHETLVTTDSSSDTCERCFEYRCLCVAHGYETCAAGAFSTLYSQCVDGHCGAEGETCNARCEQMDRTWLPSPPPRPATFDFSGTISAIGEPLPLSLSSFYSPVLDPSMPGTWYAITTAPAEGTTHILKVTTRDVVDVTPQRLLSPIDGIAEEHAAAFAATRDGIVLATRRRLVSGETVGAIYRYDGADLVEVRTFPGAERLSIDSDGVDVYVSGSADSGGFVGRITPAGYEDFTLGLQAFQVRATASDGNAFWVAVVDLVDSQPKLFSVSEGQVSERGTFPLRDRSKINS